MRHAIRWWKKGDKPVETAALGRNGRMKQIGLEAYCVDYTIIGEDISKIRLQPINSYDQVGCGSLEIPIEHVPELITMLHTLLNEFHASQARDKKGKEKPCPK